MKNNITIVGAGLVGSLCTLLETLSRKRLHIEALCHFSEGTEMGLLEMMVLHSGVLTGYRDGHEPLNHQPAPRRGVTHETVPLRQPALQTV